MKKFLIDNEELMKEWDYIKNKNISPDNITSGSDKKVWWICAREHSYSMRVSQKVKGARCPYCLNRKLLVGFNDLKFHNPELLKEWDYKKNSDDPEQVRYNSSKKVWWICPQGHSYSMGIVLRTQNRSHGCPICNHKIVKKGFNDFKTHYPILALEWDYLKNISLTPENVSYGSNKKVWWICPRCGNHYYASISNRVKGTNCPICSKEKQTSFPEQAIYYYLKKQINCENRFKIDNKEIDIYIPSLNTGIEYNGSYYHKNKQRDKNKIEFFKQKGINIISINESNYNRITNNSIDYIYSGRNDDLDNIIVKLLKMLKLNSLDIDVRRDAISIYSQYINTEKENSLSKKFPNIAKEWDYNKNGKLTPDVVRSKTDKKVWWICPRGHSYEAKVCSRTEQNNGCPYCSNHKLLKGYNDLATTSPELLKEWDFKKNSVKPDEIIGSNKKVWWVCPQGHSYFMRVSHKKDGSGCPYCSIDKSMNTRNSRYIKLKGSLYDNYQEIANEWDYKKNVKSPKEVLSYSNTKYWWICSKGHSYDASPSNRLLGRGCPYCSNHKVLKGFNDLATTNPNLSKEWNYEKNGDLLPSMITSGSKKKVWWRCSNGHEWQAVVYSRNHGNKCPMCKEKR